MKLSKLLQILSESMINSKDDIDTNELIDKYFLDVEKITNGLLTPSKILGTVLALNSTRFKNPKIAHDIAEKLLK